MLLALVFCSGGDLAAEPVINTERDVKAAYLYKFASFVEWPSAAFTHGDGSLVIGVMGADTLAEELERVIVNRNANGRRVSVRKLAVDDLPAAVHILFLGDISKNALTELLAQARTEAILTVSQSRDIYQQGSMVNFVPVDGKLRFEVALKPVGAAGLRISALMLSSALRIRKEP